MKQTTTDTASEWLGAYLDGELNEERRAWVETHLASCADCRAELRSLQELSTLLRADAQPATSRGFTGRVLAALPQKMGARSTEALPRKAALALRWFPMGLFGLWAFLEIVLAASSLVLFGLGFFPEGMLPAGAAGYGGSLNSWLSGALSMAGQAELAGMLETAARFWPSALMLALELGAAVLVAVLFLAWLGGYFSFRRAQAGNDLSQ